MRTSALLHFASYSLVVLSACASNHAAAPAKKAEYVWQDSPGPQSQRPKPQTAPAKGKQDPLEHAMELHRAGKYTEAIAAYEQLYAGHQAERPRALVADAYLRANRVEDALETWFSKSPIDAFHAEARRPCEVSARPTSAVVRNWLRMRVEHGETQVAGELLALDLNWLDCGHAQGVNEFLLKKELELIDHLPKLDEVQRQDLHLYVDVMRSISAKSLEKSLTAAKVLVGADGRLPNDSVIANALIERLVIEKPKLRASLFAYHGAELRKRAEQGDLAATRAWIRLSFDGGEEPSARLMKDLQAHGLDATSRVRDEAGAIQSFLHEVDDRLAEAPPALLKEAWLRHSDPTFAYLYLHAQLDADRLKLDSPELAQALKQFPNDVKIAVLGYALARDAKKPVRERLIAAIEADLAQSDLVSDTALSAMFIALHVDVLGKRPVGQAFASSKIASSQVNDRQASAIIQNFTMRMPVFLTDLSLENPESYRLEVELTANTQPLPSHLVGPLEAGGAAAPTVAAKGGDAWLTKASRELRAQMPENARTSLHFTSPDLSWVVACPGPDSEPDAQGLGFKRPSTKAVTITCAPARKGNAVHGLVMIDGEPLVLASMPKGPMLFSLDGQPRYGTAYIASPLCANGGLVVDAFSAVGNDRIVFAGHDFTEGSQGATQDLLLLTWNLLTGKLVEQRFSHSTFFRTVGATFEPSNKAVVTKPAR